jgi:hypothetical protein
MTHLAMMRTDAPSTPFHTLIPPPRPRAFRVGFGALTGNVQSHGILPLLATYHGSIDGAFWCTNGCFGESACTKSKQDVQTRQTADFCRRWSAREYCHRVRPVSVGHDRRSRPNIESFVEPVPVVDRRSFLSMMKGAGFRPLGGLALILVQRVPQPGEGSSQRRVPNAKTHRFAQR